MSISERSLQPGFLPETAGAVMHPLSTSRYRMFTRTLTTYLRALTCPRSLLPTSSPWISQEWVDCSGGGC